MSSQVKQVLDQLLDEAEQNGRCAFSHNAILQKALQRHRDKGHLVSPINALYARKSYWVRLQPTQKALHLIRALSILQPNWVFSHFSAALVHGLYVSNAVALPVHTVSTYKHQSRLLFHHKAQEATFQVIDGIRVTTLHRTIFDCARIAGFPEALAIADSGLASMQMSRAELCALTSEVFRGHKSIQRALAVISHADARSENGGESIARAKMIEQGFQIPDLQHEIVNPLKRSQKYRVDFYWDLPNERKVAGEFDGWIKYADKRYMGNRSTAEVLVDERERESWLNAAGIAVMRFKYKDILDGQYFAQLLRQFEIPQIHEPFCLP